MIVQISRDTPHLFSEELKLCTAVVEISNCKEIYNHYVYTCLPSKGLTHTPYRHALVTYHPTFTGTILQNELVYRHSGKRYENIVFLSVRSA